jgi:hypothetical protein
MDSFTIPSDKTEMNMLKENACNILQILIEKVDNKDEQLDIYKKNMLEFYNAMKTLMIKEANCVCSGHYSLNRLVSIADILREIKKNEIYKDLFDIDMFYKVMRIIYISHTNTYKHKDYENDNNYINYLMSDLKL